MSSFQKYLWMAESTPFRDRWSSLDPAILSSLLQTDPEQTGQVGSPFRPCSDYSGAYVPFLPTLRRMEPLRPSFAWLLAMNAEVSPFGSIMTTTVFRLGAIPTPLYPANSTSNATSLFNPVVNMFATLSLPSHCFSRKFRSVCKVTVFIRFFVYHVSLNGFRSNFRNLFFKPLLSTRKMYRLGIGLLVHG